MAATKRQSSMRLNALVLSYHPPWSMYCLSSSMGGWAPYVSSCRRTKVSQQLEDVIQCVWACDSNGKSCKASVRGGLGDGAIYAGYGEHKEGRRWIFDEAGKQPKLSAFPHLWHVEVVHKDDSLHIHTGSTHAGIRHPTSQSVDSATLLTRAQATGRHTAKQHHRLELHEEHAVLPFCQQGGQTLPCGGDQAWHQSGTAADNAAAPMMRRVRKARNLFAQYVRYHTSKQPFAISQGPQCVIPKPTAAEVGHF